MSRALRAIASVCMLLLVWVMRAEAGEETVATTDLLRAEFEKDASPFVATGAPRFESGAAVIAAGVTTTFQSPDVISGDIEVGLTFGSTFTGALDFRLAGESLLKTRHEKDGPGKFTSLRLRLRSDVVELIDGDASAAFLAFPHPRSGGIFELVVSPSAEVRLESLAIARLPFDNRDRIEGLDKERLARLCTLPREKFKLLDPQPTRIDPVYRIAVDGEAEPIIAHGRGVREDDSKFPVLDQALALSCIHPLLEYTLVGGEDAPGDPLLERESPTGPYLITKPPGVVRVKAQCGVTGQWPTLVVMDATRSRVLFRSTPSGSAAGEIFCVIPAKCDRLRIALVIPDRAPIEEFIDLKRP